MINMAGVRPTEVTNVGPQIMPASLVLFQGLKRAYASKAQEENEDSDDDEDDDEDEVNEELASSEDEIDEEGAQYIEKLEKAANNEDDDSDGEYTDDGTEETALESYQTPLDEETCPVDEYMIFKTVLQNLQANDPNWYNSLISQLTEEQRKEVEEVFKLAEQRRAAAESRKIEERGGYVFQQTSVPSSFNFGS